jgi:hypothetical protein
MCSNSRERSRHAKVPRRVYVVLRPEHASKVFTAFVQGDSLASHTPEPTVEATPVNLIESGNRATSWEQPQEQPWEPNVL